MRFLEAAAILGPLETSRIALSPSTCCTVLASTGLDNKVTYPGEEAYETSVSSYWSALAQIRPTCIVQPSTPKDVALAVKTLVNTDSCHFAVRSGGHTTWAGSANIVDGVTIDLSHLNSTSYDAESSLASIGPGARWGTVYDTLDEINVAVAGGRAGSVGVGGLILGGGNSFYAARTGLVCDNVANFEIVLATGDIVNANPETNTDLFQALKGGSNNFGIVTRFDMYAFGGGNVWGGIVVYPPNTSARQISAFVNFNNHIEDDPFASMIGIWQYSSKTGETTIANNYEYTTEVPRPPAFDEYLSIPHNISDTTRITTMGDLVDELISPAGLRDTFLTLTFENDEQVIQKMVDLHDSLAQSMDGTSSEWMMANMIQPIPTLFAKHSVERGGNVLGLDRAVENLVLFQTYFSWDNSEDDELFANAGESMISDLSAYAKSLGKDNEFIYLDYALNTQDPLKSYGSENVEKIKAVAEKYDPTEAFQRLVPGGFKISKVDEQSEVS